MRLDEMSGYRCTFLLRISILLLKKWRKCGMIDTFENIISAAEERYYWRF